MQTPTLILHNGEIYTVDESKPHARAIAIYGPLIGFLGSDEEILALRGRETQVIDLGGLFVLPGLCDAHVHFHEWSLGLGQVRLAGVSSKGEMMERIGSWTEGLEAGSWIVGRGWNESLWPEPEIPTRDELDRVAGPDHPALLWRTDMHCALANSAALKAAGISDRTTDPDGGLFGRYVGGRLDGRLYELAINLVSEHIPTPGEEQLDSAYQDGIGRLHRLGVTAIHSQRMKDQHEGPVSLNTFLRLREKRQLKLRVNSNIAAHDLPHLGALGLRAGFGDDTLRLGHIKLFSDGSMGSKTAWMLEPLASVEQGTVHAHGICVTPPQEMAREIVRAAKNGFPVSIHAIGDRANREVLDVLEELSLSAPRPPVPHRIEHVQIIDPADLPRLSQLNLTASVQPVHALDDMDIADRLLGSRANRAYRFGDLFRSGALVAFGSDAPVADPNPFLGFHAAIYRQRPENMSAGPWYGDQRVKTEQAIDAYTLGPAVASGWDDAIGSLAPGKQADLIVLDRDPFQAGDGSDGRLPLAGTKVLLTLFDGEIVHQAESFTPGPDKSSSGR